MRDLIQTGAAILVFGTLLNWLIPSYGDSFVSWAISATPDYSSNYKILTLTAMVSVLAYILISDIVETFLGFFRKKVA